MSPSLRLALLALLSTAVGCRRPAHDAGDGGLPKLGAEAEATPRSHEGHLEGQVRWLGPRPALPALEMNPSVRSVCGLSVPDNAFAVGVDGGVRDVVVWVEGPPERPVAPLAEVVLDQRDCLYQPPVFAARAGAKVRIRNSDALTHTVHARQEGQTLFNVAMPLEHMELVRQLPERPGEVDLRCDVHPWMKAVVRTFDQPHFTTTGADGHFILEGLPLGEVELHAWHPRMGEVVRRVLLGADGAHTTLDFGGPP